MYLALAFENIIIKNALHFLIIRVVQCRTSLYERLYFLCAGANHNWRPIASWWTPSFGQLRPCESGIHVRQFLWSLTSHLWLQHLVGVWWSWAWSNLPRKVGWSRACPRNSRRTRVQDQELANHPLVTFPGAHVQEVTQLVGPVIESKNGIGLLPPIIARW